MHDGSEVRAVASWTLPVTAVSPWMPMPVVDEPARFRVTLWLP